MEIKIKVAKSKNNNNIYKALVLIDCEREVTVSFDKQLILKLSGLSYKQFVDMPCGYYDIELY